MKYAFVLAILLLALPVLAATPLSGQSGTQTPLYQSAEGVAQGAFFKLTDMFGCSMKSNTTMRAILFILFLGMILGGLLNGLGFHNGDYIALLVSNGSVFFFMLECSETISGMASQILLFVMFFGTEKFLVGKLSPS